MSQIVFIDDELELLEEVKYYLEHRGHTVWTASEGEAGLRLILERKPDLVLLDLKIPGLSGLKVLKEVKKALPSLRVIAFSAYQAHEMEKEALAHGASLYLMKPVGPLELEKAVLKVLQVKSE